MAILSPARMRIWAWVAIMAWATPWNLQAADADRVTVDPGQSVIVLHSPYDDPHRLGGRDRVQWQWMQEAASELQGHLERIAGTAMPIELGKEAEAPEGRFPFHVALPHPDDTEPLATGELRWRVTDEGVWLYGNEEGGERGLFYAVCDFLERQLGVRWIEPGEEGVFASRQNPLELTRGRHAWKPSLVSRRIRRGVLRVEAPETFESEAHREKVEARNRLHDETNLWSLRMRMGGKNPAASHSFTDWWERFGETHPEYFARDREGHVMPAKGKHGAKICPSTPAVAEQLIEDWLPHKDRQDIVRCGVNDGQSGFCECGDCRALDLTKEGESWNTHLTDRYTVLANRVARMAREHREDAQVAMYAYMRTLYAPRRERLEPNIIVTLVPYVDPLDPDVVREHFDDWREAGATEFVFRPNYPFKYLKGVIPTGIDRHYFDVFQTAYEKGMIAANYDMLRHNWPVTGMAEYILARAMSEPDQPFEHWEEHYCAGYGGAADLVKAYFQYWREEVWEQRLHPELYEILSRGKGGDFDWGLMRQIDPYYTAEDFERTDAILEEAVQLARTDAQREKVMQLVLANRHARLTFNALAAEDAEKRAHAEALRRFRIVYGPDLRLQWGNIGWFERRRLNHATGIKVRYETEDGARLRHPTWDVVTDEE